MSKDRKTLKALIKSGKYQSMDNRAVDLIEAVTGQGRKMNKEEEVMGVCQALEELIEERKREIEKERKKAEEGRKRAEAGRKKAEAGRKKAEEERKKAEEQLKKAVKEERDRNLRGMLEQGVPMKKIQAVSGYSLSTIRRKAKQFGLKAAI